MALTDVQIQKILRYRARIHRLDRKLEELAQARTEAIQKAENGYRSEVAKIDTDHESAAAPRMAKLQSLQDELAAFMDSLEEPA